VCEGVSCYICNMEIYRATSEKCSGGLLVSLFSIVYHVLCVRYEVKDVMPSMETHPNTVCTSYP
jgi:hypothetical protein